MAITALKFTQASIERLSSEQGKLRTLFRDASLPQLFVRVTKAGTKTYYVRAWSTHLQKEVSITLGTHPGLSVAQAKKKARESLDLILSGHDPQATKIARRRNELTLADVLGDYLAGRSLKENTTKDYKRHLREGLAPLVSKRVIDLTETIVLGLYNDLLKHSSGARANGAMRVLRLLLNHAMLNMSSSGDPLLPSNPVSVLSKRKTWRPSKRKQNVIRHEQLPAWWATIQEMRKLGDFPKSIADFFSIILLTGLRPGHLMTIGKHEGLPSSVGHFIRKSGVFVVLPKSTQEYVIDIPLSSYALVLASRQAARYPDSPWLFPKDRDHSQCITHDSVKHWVEWVSRASGVKFTPMDVRRTFATVAESLDLSPYTIKRLMGHMVNDQQDVTAGYIVQPQSRLRKATQEITDTLIHAAETRHEASQA